MAALPPRHEPADAAEARQRDAPADALQALAGGEVVDRDLGDRVTGPGHEQQRAVELVQAMCDAAKAVRAQAVAGVGAQPVSVLGGDGKCGSS